MSRIGRKPIQIPAGVEVTLGNDAISMRGPKGAVTQKLHPTVTVVRESDTLKASVAHPEEKDERALWGLYGSLLKNMAEGVTKGYTKNLEVNGVGFRATVKGKNLELEVGFSHPVIFPIPEDIAVTVEKNMITVAGVDKYLVGETASRIRAVKKPEPYQGKGIKYADEVIRRKAGKAAKAAATA